MKVTNARLVSDLWVPAPLGNALTARAFTHVYSRFWPAAMQKRQDLLTFGFSIFLLFLRSARARISSLCSSLFIPVRPIRGYGTVMSSGKRLGWIRKNHCSGVPSISYTTGIPVEERSYGTER
ncbi:hypothetical protein IQ22_01370 [Pseudomonas duriflava]|uniref:Uncharacterized protein n=1 Tax=Pseudomonas duriflava TaxID=459528 RepID=A0A562QFD0_9PSED|nr:hypothetical protein [Pseudomonas duriflava]TWI55448.1 hypothetical protein IQ22_01370 [Pseudomonas duriflava]